MRCPNSILISHHPRCCGAGRETAERRFLHFKIKLCKNVDVYEKIYPILHMSDLSPTEKKVMDLVSRLRVVRSRDVVESGFHPEHLRRLVGKGRLQRLSRGVYAPTDFEATEHHGLAQVAIRTPESVVCLLSALLFHDLTTQLPSRVWIAIPPRARNPISEWPPVEVHRFSGKSFSEGWTEHHLESVPVKIFDPAKTVADCFKFRNKVGLDIAIDALRDCLGRKRATVEELIHFAKICRVDAVMKPYLEAMV